MNCGLREIEGKVNVGLRYVQNDNFKLCTYDLKHLKVCNCKQVRPKMIELHVASLHQPNSQFNPWIRIRIRLECDWSFCHFWYERNKHGKTSYCLDSNFPSILFYILPTYPITTFATEGNSGDLYARGSHSTMIRVENSAGNIFLRKSWIGWSLLSFKSNFFVWVNLWVLS